MKLRAEQYIGGLVRIGLGWIFLWAFIDKVFGLGFATKAENAWILGASPTEGFLKFGTSGPLAPLFQTMAGSVVVDWLFMLGLFSVGVALLFGIAMRLAGYAGALMMLFIYLASALPPEHNPILDDHIIYILVLIGFTFVPVGEWLGFGSSWSKSSLVRQFPWLG